MHFTDNEGNALKETGVWDDKTNAAYNKELQYYNNKSKPQSSTASLQEGLNKNGYTDYENKELKVDGIFGAKTDYAYNDACKNNLDNLLMFQNRQYGSIIKEHANNTFAKLLEKAETRKIQKNNSTDVKNIQEFLKTNGYTDIQGKDVAVNGKWDKNTAVAFEKYIKSDIFDEDVLNLQKTLNKYGIPDNNGLPLMENGKFTKETDIAANNAVVKFSNINDNWDPVALASNQNNGSDTETIEELKDFLTIGNKPKTLL